MTEAEIARLNKLAANIQGHRMNISAIATVLVRNPAFATWQDQWNALERDVSAAWARRATATEPEVAILERRYSTLMREWVDNQWDVEVLRAATHQSWLDKLPPWAKWAAPAAVALLVIKAVLDQRRRT